MITKRIIPCLDVKNGRVVKGVNFEGLQDMADPVEMARYYNASGADELVFYDITASVEGRGLFTDILRRVASQIFIPLTVGGGINTLDDFDRVLKCGADKVSVNSGAIRNPGIIPAAAQKYGNQCVVLSADIKRVDGKFMLFAKGGRENTGIDALDWLEQGVKNGAGESWDMWKNIAKQALRGEFGNPDAFCSNVEATNWMSATVETSNEEVIRHIMKICKRDPREGKVTTGGIVTVKDSTENWYLSWTINRQPQFKSQDKNAVLIWLYSLSTNKEGNFVKKAMRDCTGEEVCREWLYHIGVPTDEIEDLAKNACNTTTCFMPYINAFFQPRKNEDRPKVVPDGAVNFAFIGQFAETPRDTIFTTEYSMRTGMESVYTLLNVDRGVPEVWGSKYDVRELLRACYYAIDKKPITDIKLSFKEKELLKIVMKKVKGTDIELLLKESGLIK